MPSKKELAAWGNSIQARYAEGLVLPTKREAVDWVKEAIKTLESKDVCYLLGVAEGFKYRDKKRR